MREGIRSFALVCTLALSSCVATDASRALQRSAFFQGTATAVVGVLELEGAAGWDPSEALRTEVSLAYGLDERTELALGLQPYLEVDRPGPDARGAGNLTLGLTRRLVGEGDRGGSLALLLEAEIPSGRDDPDLASGETEVAAGLVGVAEHRGVVAIGAYRLGAPGEADSVGVDVIHRLDATLAGSLAPGVALFAGLSGSFVPETGDDESSALLGSALELGDWIVLDVGARFDLSGPLDGVEWLIGLTVAF